MVIASLAVQVAAFVTVTLYVPALATVMVGVFTPVLHA